MKASTKGVNLVIERSSGVGLGATGQHVSEHVGGTSGSEGIVTGAGSNVHTNGGSGSGGLLSGDTDAV